jgi:hypothetical protein
MLHDITHMWNLTKLNSQKQRVKQCVPQAAEEGREGRGSYKIEVIKRNKIWYYIAR